MPKLYYTPTSCGAASFIAAHVAGVQLDVEQVDLRSHTTSSGTDFYKINVKGNVPALVLEDGTVLNEGSAVLQFIADQAPGKVAPDYGTSGRYLVQNALNYIASEVHPNIAGLFFALSGEPRTAQLAKANKKLEFVENSFIGDRNFLVGDSFTIADSYLYIVLSWTAYVGVELTPYPKTKAYFDRIKTLPEVQASHARIATNPSTVL